MYILNSWIKVTEYIVGLKAELYGWIKCTYYIVRLKVHII